MKKISGVKVAELLRTIPGTLRTLAAERDEALEKAASLQSRVADYERDARVTKVAEMAHGRHMVSLGETVQDKVASIHEALEQGKSLEVMEQAIAMNSPDGSLGALEKEGGIVGEGAERSSRSAAALLDYLRSGR